MTVTKYSTSVCSLLVGLTPYQAIQRRSPVITLRIDDRTKTRTVRTCPYTDVLLTRLDRDDDVDGDHII